MSVLEGTNLRETGSSCETNKAALLILVLKSVLLKNLVIWLAQAESEEYTEVGRRAEWKEKNRVLLLFYHTTLELNTNGR